jgi:hypothetical protein
MPDDQKNFEIAIVSTAKLDAAKEATTVITGLKQGVEQAGRSTLDLTDATKKSGEAAQEAGKGHGHAAGEVKALRIAATAAKEAGWAFQAVMRGDYVVAMHEAKFATIGLTTAVKANPLGWLVFGASAAITALELFMHRGDEAGDHVKELGNESEKAGKKAEASAPLWGDLGRATGDAAEKSDLLKQRLEAEKTALEEAKKSVDEMAGAYRKMRQAKDELLDAGTQLKLAEVDNAEAAGLINPEEARAQRAGIKLGDQKQKLAHEEEAARGDLASAQESKSSAAGVAQEKEAALARARDDYAAAMQGMEAAGARREAGVPLDRQAEEARARANYDPAERKKELMFSTTGRGGLTAEQADARIAKEQAQAKALAALAHAEEEIGARRKAASEARTAALAAERATVEKEAEIAPKLAVIALKKKTLAMEGDTEEQRRAAAARKAQEDDAKARAAQEAEEAKQRQARTAQDIDRSLAVLPKDDSRREELQRSKAALDYAAASGIDDPQKRALEQQRIRDAETARNPGRAAAADAAGVAGAHVREDSVTGDLARDVQRAAREAYQPGAGAEANQLLKETLQVLLDQGRLNGEEQMRLRRDLELAKKQVEQMAQQAQNNRR